MSNTRRKIQRQRGEHKRAPGWRPLDPWRQECLEREKIAARCGAPVSPAIRTTVADGGSRVYFPPGIHRIDDPALDTSDNKE